MPSSRKIIASPLIRRLEISSGRLSRFVKDSDSVTGLPRDLSRHWRGVRNERGKRVYGRFDAGDVLLPEYADPRKKADWLAGDSWTLCHNKPISSPSKVRGDESRFPDIPDRLDLFFLLTTQFESIAFVGLRRAAIIRRNHETAPALEKLAEWLKDPARGKYRKTRGRAQLRTRRQCVPTEHELRCQFARSALRAAGLRWPGKPRDREREWPDCLRELGLTVELTDAPPFTPRRIHSSVNAVSAGWRKIHRPWQ